MSQTSPPRTGRTAIVFLLILALMGTMGTRFLADRQRAGTLHITASGGGSQSLGSMNSFTLALLLGGLRGPLVMVLWSSSEESKNQRQLEDFDTKLEFIRMLQPEFMRVHIFQMWNKAYNISVQRASKANKYADIIDAIEYGEKVSGQFPNNINIITELGRLWGDKLGGDAQQKPYYFRRVRAETCWRENAIIRRSGAKPLELAPRLDPQGNILPKYREELKYLIPFEPFPNGLPPRAIGYNYIKQAQVLQSDFHQKHLDMGGHIVSSRPAMTVKMWGQDEMDRGRRMELAALTGEQVSLDIDRSPLQMLTADLPVSSVISDRGAFDEALANYACARQAYDAAMKEYERHLKGEFSGDEWTFRSHMDDVEAERLLARADQAYLLAMAATGAERKAQGAKAAEAYQMALDQFRRIILKYYVDDSVALALYQKHTADPAGKPALAQMDSQQLSQIYQKALLAVKKLPSDPNRENLAEYSGFLERTMVRLSLLRGEAGR